MKPKTSYIHKSLAFKDTPEVLHLLEDCNEIMRRDQWSFSMLTFNALTEFNQHHGPDHPNPQAKLFSPLPDRIPNVLCEHIIGVTKDRQILCKKRGSDYHSQKHCAECEHNRLRGDPYG